MRVAPASQGRLQKQAFVLTRWVIHSSSLTEGHCRNRASRLLTFRECLLGIKIVARFALSWRMRVVAARIVWPINAVPVIEYRSEMPTPVVPKRSSSDGRCPQPQRLHAPFQATWQVRNNPIPEVMLSLRRRNTRPGGDRHRPRKQRPSRRRFDASLPISEDAGGIQRQSRFRDRLASPRGHVRPVVHAWASSICSSAASLLAIAYVFPWKCSNNLECQIAAGTDKPPSAVHHAGQEHGR